MAASKNSNSALQAAYYKAMIILLGFLSVVVIVFYFWGAVQVDFVNRKNSDLEKARDALLRECEDLNIQIDGLQSFQRIAKQAKQQGIAMPRTENVKELHVDFSGVEYFYHTGDLGIRYADMNPLGGLRTQNRNSGGGVQE